MITSKERATIACWKRYFTRASRPPAPLRNLAVFSNPMRVAERSLFSPASVSKWVNLTKPTETGGDSVRRGPSRLCNGVQTKLSSTAQLAEQEQLVAVLREYRTESGRSLLEVVDESPVLLIFLRHFGCAFCRQALDQVAQIRSQIAARGAQPVFVHLGSPDRAKPTSTITSSPPSNASAIPMPPSTRTRLRLIAHESLSESSQSEGLERLAFGRLAQIWNRRIQEDAHQMPGVFFLKDRRIVRGFRYQTIADEPDYLKLIGPAR